MSSPSISLAPDTAKDAHQNATIANTKGFPWELMRRCLYTCKTHHAECAPSKLEASEIVSGLRFIDVKQNSIVEGSIQQDDGYKYIALSYVWGDPLKGEKHYTLSRSNKDQLMQPGGLEADRVRIGLTIRHAIEFASLMEIQYLWVDSLCLVQDDEDEKNACIPLMGMIYEQAHFTIVAANGSSVYNGLPDHQDDTHGEKRHTTEVATWPLEGFVHFGDMITDSEYSQRVWTFQEFHLSRRKIVFAGGRIYFVCGGGQCNDDGKWSLHLQLNFEEISTNPFYSLTTLLEKYSERRKSRYQTDALKAAEGICYRYSRLCKSPFLQGMPVAIFDTFMLFRRRAPMGGRRSEFPSYSWLGWKHGVQIPNFIDKTNLKEWKISCTWIVWYKRTSGAPDLVWDTTKSTVLLQEIGSKTGYRGRTSRDPTGELSMLGDHLKESFPQGFKDGVEKRKRCHFSVSEFASINPASQTPPSLNSLLSSKRPYDLLQFWTISTYYKIHLAFNQYKDCDEYFPLFDKDQEFCGIVRLDEEPPGNEAVHAEFLILSKACHDISKDVIWSTPVMERLSLLSQEMKESPLCNANRERYSAEEEIFHDDLYCVLCIQWKDDGVAERVGSGFIYRTAVEHAHFPGPVWKEIILG